MIEKLGIALFVVVITSPESPEGDIGVVHLFYNSCIPSSAFSITLVRTINASR
jgi:hypothetical protein